MIQGFLEVLATPQKLALVQEHPGIFEWQKTGINARQF
jgi:hypothetical protein